MQLKLASYISLPDHVVMHIYPIVRTLDSSIFTDDN